MEEAMLKAVSLAIGLALVQVSSSAPAAEAIEMGSLQGAVRDENGKPVTAAPIKIRNVERGITVTGFSPGGTYRAPGLVPGNSQLAARPAAHPAGAPPKTSTR